MKTEKIYMAIPKQLNDLNYSISRTPVESVSDDFKYVTFEVIHADEAGTYVIQDAIKQDGTIVDIVELCTDANSLQKVINAVKMIPGYSGDVLEEVLIEIFNCPIETYKDYTIVKF